ncbi:uncharacterized protein [Nicotiana sylvestris]|uniref:uncharacterized protein n=1 Tax=Nicotiana sylvestris TaxID=4096 RepID=UPI00388C382F
MIRSHEAKPDKQLTEEKSIPKKNKNEEHRQALMIILNEVHVPDKISINHLGRIANRIFEANRITFSDDELPVEGLRDAVAMRLPPTGEEEIPKPSKEKKRKRGLSANSPKPKKSKTVSLHRQAFAKSRAKISRCEAELKKVVEERDSLKILYVKKEGEISDLRSKLAKARQEQTELIEKVQQKGELVEQLREELQMKELQSVREESLARSHKIEELEANYAAELAKAKSDAKAFVSSYRADAEAAKTWTKEISIAVEVKLPCDLGYARRQSRRQTLEEVHARGFDLSADIDKAKTLEEEAAALLSDNGDLASGSESGGD